jgi:hypothetical protein
VSSPQSHHGEPVSPDTSATAVNRRRRTPLILGGVAAVLLVSLGVVVGAAIASPGAEPTTAAAAQQRSYPDEDGSTPFTLPPTTQPTATPPTTAAVAASLSTDALTLTPKVVKKQCFGSAGCNVSIKIEVGYDGPPLSEDDTWEVTYEVTGDESGPIIQSFELVGERYDQDEISMSTKSSKTKISAEVTDVSEAG